MVGGAYRGPVGFGRQRRTIRIVQVLLVLIAGGLLVFAGYSMGQSSGYERGQKSDELGAPSKPGVSQTIALTILGLAFLGGAFAIQSEGGVRLLTPARLRDMELRGEGAPIRMEEAPNADAATTPPSSEEAADATAPRTSE
jgi:hypothetical protein